MERDGSITFHFGERVEAAVSAAAAIVEQAVDAATASLLTATAEAAAGAVAEAPLPPHAAAAEQLDHLFSSGASTSSGSERLNGPAAVGDRAAPAAAGSSGNEDGAATAASALGAAVLPTPQVFGSADGEIERQRRREHTAARAEREGQQVLQPRGGASSGASHAASAASAWASVPDLRDVDYAAADTMLAIRLYSWACRHGRGVGEVAAQRRPPAAASQLVLLPLGRPSASLLAPTRACTESTALTTRCTS